MLCSVCKKNVAVIFVNKIVDGKMQSTGLCIPCAKKQGLAPMDQIMQQSGFMPEDFDNINNQLTEVMGDLDLDQLADNMGSIENGDVESFDKKDLGNLMNFMNTAFSGNLTNKNNEEDQNLANIENLNNDTSKGGTKVKEKSKRKKRKYLDTYGINLTTKALEGGIDRIVGREKEIDRVIQILNRRSKNNPVLIGEPGVGKTAIAEGLAVKIADKQVPVKLYNTEIYLLDLTALVAGTQFRGQFESRMKALIDEARKAGNIILIIDEIHNIVGAGDAESGAMNAANILKPALAKGEIQVIGATTLNEYRKHIEKDTALERRFQPVIVDEPSISDSIEILMGIKDYYENYHKVKISQKIVETAVKMSERYITDRFLPDKAIDVIDEAGSRVNLKNKGLIDLEALRSELNQVKFQKEEAATNDNYEKAAECKVNELRLEGNIAKLSNECENIQLTEEDIAYVIESWTKVPVQKITEVEAEKLIHLEDRLHKRVIGQQKAVEGLSRAIRRSRSGFRKKRKPASFIFVGPTGVGKTELARTLAYEMFENEEAMIRIDMSEYMEKHTVSKLIGAPPGYVGFDQAGFLTEKIRRKPYSVILLDEIEKAHSDVFNILLQILEDGRLTDNQGRTVNFENTIIIMTSNIGNTGSSNLIGFGYGSNKEYNLLEAKIQAALKETFKPEFLNRVDEIVVFNELTKEELRKIVDLMLEEVIEEANEKSITINVSEEMKDFILEKGYDPKYGARPLRRTIQKYVEDEISESFLKGELREGSTVDITVKDEKTILDIK
ncbi:ATP-dependent Clp protease ATP-binding subunit [Sedimentibacter sp. zth1]|nr:ATP-dependent Clp protease ATP-binding subunit [Sedimentibacter sp. zth1]